MTKIIIRDNGNHAIAGKKSPVLDRCDRSRGADALSQVNLGNGEMI
ncbi:MULTISPECIES: hypothetical protein [Planktothricoides]|uniref:Uncharacterized protein n=2 Tax=Planktothricoides raciborskii TaxID=132608 RepID=A0AAU8JDF1_9CYAN|nr:MULTISPECIES: hypothetical protein [Planktothricoides]MBD2544546.1 hypothetical protein [Planktothricoides raciborskii FACHB-1370]MBD2585552.1 hypothetical protein [Planktothricoides raciborskii FACHB-1261]